MRNRINNYGKSLWFGIVLLTLAACNDWLDVDPKSQVKDKDLFSSEMGFKEALSGVYSIMTQEYLYGKEMTFGMLGVLGQEWDSQPTDYTDDLNYKYENTRPEVRIDSLWCGLYNAIANTNKLLGEIDAKKSLFTNPNYEVIKGEALALRGFLHLELLRMFGPIPGETAANQLAIPYVEELTKDPNKLLTLTYSEVITKIIKDLDEAEQYLKEDPIMAEEDPTDEWQKNRGYRFNYYAVKAAKARYYRWIGNAPKAAQYAQEVIDSKKFALATENDYSSSGGLVMLKEHLFGVHSQNHQSIIEPYFSGSDPLLTQSTNYIQTAYENITGDIRNVTNRYWQSKQSPDYWWITVNYFLKYMDGSDFESPNTIPVLRLAEMYLILTESASQDVAKPYFYQYLIARNVTLSWVDDVADSEKLKARLEKEYRKEFWGEGQMWFWYKRWNYEKFTWPSSFTVPQDGYLIPIPQSQTMFD